MRCHFPSMTSSMVRWSVRIAIILLCCESIIISEPMDGSINTSDRIRAGSSSSVVDPMCSIDSQRFITELSANKPLSPPVVLTFSIILSYFNDHMLLFILIVFLSISLGVVMGLIAHSILWPHPNIDRIQHRNSSSSRDLVADATGISFESTDSLFVEHHHSQYASSSEEAMSKEKQPRDPNNRVDVLFPKDMDVLDTKPSMIPRHIAVIMDGNRRFGKEVHSDPLQGHWSGGQTLVDFIQWCKQDGVEVVTAYAFSTENWRRDPAEVHALMALFAQYANTFRTEALTHNVRVNVLSTDRDKLPVHVKTAIDELQAATEHCNSFIVNICLSYGSRSDIVASCQELCSRVQSGDLALSDIDESRLGANLCTRNLPDPDLLIRTSGEHRLSNFLLWQMAYTELFFVDKYWPQLTRRDYRSVLHQYAARSRRFGV